LFDEVIDMMTTNWYSQLSRRHSAAVTTKRGAIRISALRWLAPTMRF